MEGYNYIELVLDEFWKRGNIVPLTDLKQIIGQRRTAYRSMWLFSEDIFSHLNRTGAIKFYNGDFAVDVIDIDVDYPDKADFSAENDAKLKQLVEAVLFTLFDEFNIPDYNVVITFSGTGFNILLPATAFGEGFAPSPDLPYIVKHTMKKLFGDLIDNIYDVGRIYRVMNTVNPKSGLFKIPLSLSEFRSMDMMEIRELAQEPRLDIDFIDEDWKDCDPILEDFVIEDMPDIDPESKPHTKNNARAAVCVSNLWDGNTVVERNNTAMRIASHYQRSGIPEGAASELLLSWGRRVGLEDKEALRVVQQVYKNEYTYSCQDHILKANCSTECLFYRGQNYGEGGMALNLLSTHQMKADLVAYLSQDFTGRMIDLAAMFGFQGKDWRLVPGNVLVVMAGTGGGKSAFVQQITTESKVNTIYGSLEMSPLQMYRRSGQQVTGLSKDEINAMIISGQTDFDRHISHVHYVQSYSLDMNEIHELIRTYEGQFITLVIDHLKLISTTGGVDYASLGEITRQLKMLALQYNIIIIEVSQVSNEVARKGQWDAVSGSGNGSVGHDADMVIALIGDNNRRERELRVLKNRDGDQGISFDGVLNDSFQLVRDQWQNPMGSGSGEPF